MAENTAAKTLGESSAAKGLQKTAAAETLAGKETIKGFESEGAQIANFTEKGGAKEVEISHTPKKDFPTVPEHERRLKQYESYKLMENNRIRYYTPLTKARNPGDSLGLRAVTEVDADTGNVIRTWTEVLNQDGRIKIVRPKSPKLLPHIIVDPNTGDPTGETF